jgi:PAS domain S-box-containing protein
MYDQSGHRRPPVNFKVHGLYGRVVLDGKSLLTNEPKSHPESIGTPSGHPPLTAFLGVPLIHHGMTIGIVGLANREGGYTLEHQQAIEAITPAIVEAFFRKRAETGLRESRSQLDLALRSAQMGVWHLNLIENKRHFDDQTCHLLGIDGAKFTGTDDEFYKAIHPDDREMLKAVWARTIDQGAPYEMEFRAVWPDGSVHYVLSRAKLFRNETGQRVRFNGLIWDITERKRAEEELHKAKEEAEMHAKELEALMDAVPALIWITRDTECLSMTGNRAVYEFLGMPTGANVSKTAPEAARPVHFKALRDGMEIPLDELPMQQAAKGKGTQDCELEYVFDDGTSKITLGNTTPLYDVTGQAYGAIAAFVDITQRKRMEEELRKSRDELELRVRERTAELVGTVTRLEQLNEELQEFAFIASHDLQEPLRKIQAFGSILARKHKESLDPEGQDYMERITKAANRMSELLRALLSYSRSGTSQLNYEPVSLTEVAKDAASDLEIMINRAKGSVEISALPTVDADAPLLRELFQNFIGNSIKYRKESEPPVVKIYGKVAGATCQVMIEDNGIGFDECYSHKIFKPFERLHGRNAPYTGTGMGLAICKKIVNRHGGEITVRSIPEGGTTFIVSLPIAQEKMVEWESKTLHS